MEFIKTERDGLVLIATLARGKANAINVAMLEELHCLVQQVAPDDNVRALVLGGGSSGFFSAGFDVREVFRYDADEIRPFFGKFVDVYEGIQELPKGVVAAVSGHAYAGGAVLALSCDWRIMADSSCRIALNEVNIGIIVPPGITSMVVNLLGAGYARQLLLTGEPVNPSDALRIGLVHELAPADEVLKRAIARGQQFAAKPADAFAAIKQKLRCLTGKENGSDRDRLETFIEQWDSDEGRLARRALLESMER